MQAIVLAATGGPEFGPLCQNSPKAMLPFLGEPLLAGVIRWLERYDASDVAVSLHLSPYPAEAHFEARPPAKARLRFHLDKDEVGTANVVKRLGAAARDTIVVCEGQLVTAIDLEAVFEAHKANHALVTAVLVPGERAALAARATIDADGRLLDLCPANSDAAQLASAGIFLIEPEALVHVGPDRSELVADFLPALMSKNLPVFTHVSTGYWMDGGQPAGYIQALTDALHARIPGVVPGGVEVQPGVWIEDGAHVNPKAKLTAPCFIAKGARLASEVKVGPGATVEGGTLLERGASVRAAAVLPGARLGRATSWEAVLLYPDGWIDLATWPAAVRASDDSTVLGTTWAEPLSDRLHTVFDQTAAFCGLFTIAPLLLLLILAIRLDSQGPAFYTQLRVGRDRRPYRPGTPRGEIFECFKFRTMHVDADQKVEALRAQNHYGDSAFFKMDNDPRITRIGHFLRKTSLDELPQLFNVLLGEMRLVGNRPLPVYEAEALREDWQRTRFLAPAGITGLWQISGRSDLSEKERLALDAYYSVTRTFTGDLSILFRTVPALLARRGAR